MTLDQHSQYNKPFVARTRQERCEQVHSGHIKSLLFASYCWNGSPRRPRFTQQTEFTQGREVTRFDLTFKGTILPDHDPQEVKHRFAELFVIKDPFVLDQLFSGDTFVIRSNLDRKSAADYFRKVVDLGGQAELVPNNGSDSGQATRDMFSRIEAVTNPEERTGEILANGDGFIDQRWPVSAARGGAAPALRVVPSGPQSEKDPHDPETAAEEARLRSELAELRLARDNAEATAAEQLKELGEARTEAEEKYSKELSRVKIMREQAAARGEEALARIQSEEDSAQQQSVEQVQHLKDEKLRKERETEQLLAELDHKIDERKNELQGKVERIQQNRQETQSTADEAIAKLQRLIEETRAQADADIAELDVLLAETQESLEISSLEFTEQREDILQQSAEEQDRIQTELDESLRQTEQRLSELAESLEAEEEKSRENVSQLEEMEIEVEQRWSGTIEELQQQIRLTQRDLEEKLENLSAAEARLRHTLNTICD